MNILIGADPELFVKKDGVVVSGHDLIQGTKADPFPVQDGAVQVDGMALEFNIDPAPSVEDFTFNITSVMTQLQDMVPDHELLLDSVAHFDEAYLEGVPKSAKVLGCDPDFNAYTERENKSPDASRTMRTAAGHIHIGWTEGEHAHDDHHFSKCIDIVKQLDIYLGIPSLLYDEGDERREMYGKAGAFRPKSYGVEYRVLSNKWLQSKELMEQVYNNACQAVVDIMDGTVMSTYILDAETIINTGNKDRAKAIVKDMGW